MQSSPLAIGSTESNISVNTEEEDDESDLELLQTMKEDQVCLKSLCLIIIQCNYQSHMPDPYHKKGLVACYVFKEAIQLRVRHKCCNSGYFQIQWVMIQIYVGSVEKA